MSGTIRRSPMYQGFIGDKKNIWDGSAILQVGYQRIPIRIVEMQTDYSRGCEQALRYICEDVALERCVYSWATGNGIIKKVVYNNPATIVFWMDGTKTVVKCSPDDEYSPETGLLMAIAKKFLGNNTAAFNKELRKWFPKKEESENASEEYKLGSANE